MTTNTDLSPSAQQPFRAADHLDDGKPHLLLACTGSVATIKLPNILHALSTSTISIRVILSKSASEFLQGQSAEQPALPTLLRIRNVEAIYRDEDEWSTPWQRGSNILHIELRRWADAMVIAPLSADSLAKLANGMADSLVLAVARAWDTTGLIDPARPGLLPSGCFRTETGKKLVVVAPAMNTAMWLHPVTRVHLDVLQTWGVEKGGWVRVLEPVQKELACGDTGAGAMRDWKEIVAFIETLFALNKMPGGDDGGA